MRATFNLRPSQDDTRVFCREGVQTQIDPGAVFDRTVVLDDVPTGYAEMDARTALKVMVTV